MKRVHMQVESNNWKELSDISEKENGWRSVSINNSVLIRGMIREFIQKYKKDRRIISKYL